MSDTKSRASINLPSDFRFGEHRPDNMVVPSAAPPPPLGPLAFFVGDFVGNGFNTIFRPDSAATPTILPNPVPPPPPPRDNILELNLTSENLSFSKSLGTVPNRGTGVDASPGSGSGRRWRSRGVRIEMELPQRCSKTRTLKSGLVITG